MHSRNDIQKHDREMDKLKKIIGEIIVANDVLKKCWRSAQNEYHDNHAKTRYQNL